MAFDLETFKQSVMEPQPDPNTPRIDPLAISLKATPRADEKMLVKGYIIEQVWENTDQIGVFYVLDLTDQKTGEVGIPYILRNGDLPALPFAEELDRELELGLITMQYGPPPVITHHQAGPPIPTLAERITALEAELANMKKATQ